MGNLLTLLRVVPWKHFLHASSSMGSVLLLFQSSLVLSVLNMLEQAIASDRVFSTGADAVRISSSKEVAAAGNDD